MGLSILPMQKDLPLLVLVGPTASGKTALGIALAQHFSGEIVSADSMQVYRGMDIATAKPTPEERQGVPHHMMDILPPEEAFSVADYSVMARRCIAEIHERGHLPILVGGTGLYIDAVAEHVVFPTDAGQPALREDLRRLAGEKGNGYLLERLRGVDPELADKLHPNNLGRIIRALEVYETTGIPLSRHNQAAKSYPSPYRSCWIGLRFEDREALYARINHRVDAMLQQGLLEEARHYLPQLHATARQAIGYKELAGYIRGEIPLEEAVESLKRSTRQYAKRQLTWFRRNTAIHWITVDDYEEPDGILQEACSIVRQAIDEGRDIV